MKTLAKMIALVIIIVPALVGCTKAGGGETSAQKAEQLWSAYTPEQQQGLCWRNVNDRRALGNDLADLVADTPKATEFMLEFLRLLDRNCK